MTCTRSIYILWSGILFSFALGCEPSYHIADVDGVVLVQGKPATKVQLQFIPDIDAQTTGPVSFGATDADGKFSLTMQEHNGASSLQGAVVGSHRVVLTDLELAASATGRGVPIRFGPEYSSVASTPLKQVVKEGKQTIEIRVP
jgi:hypothetical protein